MDLHFYTAFIPYQVTVPIRLTEFKDHSSIDEAFSRLHDRVILVPGTQEQEDFIRGMLLLHGKRNQVVSCIEDYRDFDKNLFDAPLLFTHKFRVERHPHNAFLLIRVIHEH